MKIRNFISVSLLSFVSLTLAAQEQTRIPGGISMAFKAGSAAELAKYMNPTIELSLLDKEDFYKKNVAEAILKDFFTSYPSKDFIVRHQGSKNDAQYAIGNLKTEKGDFRVYYLLKKVGQEQLIQQIRIEPESGK
ncbi:MAG: DUF4783 domain-containing protein [Bacteroidales bacterium]|jgi:hypothetical protein